MTIEVSEINVRPEGLKNLDGLNVSVAANVITVSAATLTIDDLVDYAFEESEYTHVVDGAEVVHLVGWIVRDTADDSLQLFVDDWIQDGADDEYDFSSGTLVPKFRLFFFQVQVGADAADAEIQKANKTKQYT